jgi:hypothetical protein
MKKILFLVLLASPFASADEMKDPQENLAKAMFLAGAKFGQDIMKAKKNLKIEISDGDTNQSLGTGIIKLCEIVVDNNKLSKLSIEYRNPDGTLVELTAQEGKSTGSLLITTPEGKTISGPVGYSGSDSPISACYFGFVLAIQQGLVNV